MQQIRIISRNSKLAIWQSEFVKEKLVAIQPHLEIKIISITTQGDKIVDKALDKVGGKGLFIKELENALIEDKADIAVHSLKDVSVNLASSFVLAAILERSDAKDAFISNKYNCLEDMVDSSIVGTSSNRRIALLKKFYPQLQTKLLRGNVDTRLKKLDSGEYDGIILAAAGLQRLGFANRIKQNLDVTKFIPAIGQGALAIEVLKERNDLIKFLALLMHQNTKIVVAAEREVGRIIGADCSVPIGVYANLVEDKIIINAMMANIEKDLYYFAEVVGHKDKFLELAKECANKILDQIEK